MSRVEKSLSIDGQVVVDRGKQVGAYSILEEARERYNTDLTLYFVDPEGTVVGSITLEADSVQGTPYVSDYKVKVL